MSRWWLLHGVGDADLGVSSNRSNADRRDERERRRRALHEITDVVILRDRLVLLLGWKGPVTGPLSPLAVATRAVPPDDPVRLVLVSTDDTRSIAEALAVALNRAPNAFGRQFEITIAHGKGTPHSGGLTEDEIAAALAPHLREAGENDRAMITWGSGSTQLSFGSVEAVISARLPWLFANVGPQPPAQPYVLLDPGQGLQVDPLVPLLRRWRYHDRLAALIDSGEITASEELRRAVLADGERWREAHLRPTAENLRWLMTDALMRGDATSCFAVRSYVLARYRQLREEDDPQLLDLVDWATRKLREVQKHPPTLGQVLERIRQGDAADRAALEPSARSRSGSWLTGKMVEILNEAGSQASHALAPPPARLRRHLRQHPDALPTHQPTAEDVAALLPATAAWYVAIVGEGATKPGRLPHPMQTLAASGADPEVAGYLGVPDPKDVDRRYLVLGTDQRSAGDAAELARRVNIASPPGTGEAAVAGTVPDLDATPPFDAGAAYALLRDRFEHVRDDVGALVLIPTGPKQLVLPLLMAGFRLAAEEGIPLFLRQLIGPRTMHLLPVRFGAEHHLLGIALHALDIVELDVAARLLDSCSAGRELAARARRLRSALRCDDPERGGGWPEELPGTWSRQARSTGLIAQRLEIWAGLAEAQQEPAHGVRAVLGACAVLEHGIRVARPRQRGESKRGDLAWRSFQQETHERAKRRDGHARVLRALLEVRNDLPITHGASLAPTQNLDAVIAHALRSPRPVTVAELLRLAAGALRQWPRSGDVSADAASLALPTLLDRLRADVRGAWDSELARLAHAQAQTRRTETDILDRLGAAVIEAVAPSASEA